MEKRYVNVNGVELAYQDVGGGGRPFILVHGFTGNRHDFRDHLDHLAELGRTVVYDQRGHGDSTHTGDADSYTFEQLVEDLRGFLDALAIERCDLLGHSMGGMIALRFALAYPRRVASLILMDTSARAPDGMPRAPLVAAAAIARSDGMAKLAELMRGRAADDPARPAASRRLEAEMGADEYWGRHQERLQSMDPEAFATLGPILLDQQPLTDRLSAIACPTMVIVGEEDEPFLRPAEEFVQRIPAVTQVTVPDAAHSPQLENAGVWFAAISDHLGRVRGEQ